MLNCDSWPKIKYEKKFQVNYTWYKDIKVDIIFQSQHSQPQPDTSKQQQASPNILNCVSIYILKILSIHIYLFFKNTRLYYTLHFVVYSYTGFI